MKGVLVPIRSGTDKLRFFRDSLSLASSENATRSFHRRVPLGEFLLVLIPLGEQMYILTSFDEYADQLDLHAHRWCEQKCEQTFWTNPEIACNSLQVELEFLTY
jgi:hypothetical protein